MKKQSQVTSHKSPDARAAGPLSTANYQLATKKRGFTHTPTSVFRRLVRHHFGTSSDVSGTLRRWMQPISRCGVPRPMLVSGFTLIETFVAITILVTAVVGPLTLAQKGLTSALLARDQLMASFLAQEGIEYIRQQRDSNSLQELAWLAGLSSCEGQDCMLDTVADSAPVACSGGCLPLRYDETTHFYGYDASDMLSSYTRTVRIDAISAYESRITSTVVWQSGIFTRQVSLSEIITDWQ